MNLTFLEIFNWNNRSKWLRVHRWAGGGVRGGFYPVWKFFSWPPSKIQNDPHPLRNGFWPPIRFWAGDVFFLRKDIKKICPEKNFFAGLCRHQFLAKEGQNSHKNFIEGPPWPPLFQFFMTPLDPLAKKSFDPPLEMATLLTYDWDCIINREGTTISITTM